MKRSARGLVGALLCLVGTTSLAGEVELRNASFEEPALAGWQLMTGAQLGSSAPVSEVVLDDTVARTGDASLRFTSTAETRLFRLACQSVPVEGNQRVICSAYARADGARRELKQFRNANLTLSFLGPNGRRLGFHVSSLLLGDRDWTRLVVEAIAPPGAVEAQIGAFCSVSGSWWVDDFELRVDPTLPFDADVRRTTLDALADHLDRSYSYFGFGDRPASAAELLEPARESLLGAPDETAFVDGLAKALGTLRDQHVWIETPRGVLPTYQPATPLRNWNLVVVERALDEVLDRAPTHTTGRVGDVGYLLVKTLRMDAAAQERLRDAVVALDDAERLIIDLRPNSGGNEEIAQWLFGRFTGEPLVYARTELRDPTRPTDDGFGEAYDRTLRPVLPGASDERRVVVLQGGWCMSSAEGALLMARALPNVTTVGRRSRGATGNPRPWAVLPGIVLRSSTWRTLDLEGRQVQDLGVAPDVEIDVVPEVYRDDDPEFRRALELLAE